MSKKDDRLPITVQAAKRIYNWARVMSNGIALNEMAK